MTTTELPHALNREWAAAFNAGDLDTLMGMYEPDAVLVPGPGAEPVQGPAPSAPPWNGSSAWAGRCTSPPGTGWSVATWP